MKTQESKMEHGGWQTRSVLECASPLALFHGGQSPRSDQSGRGLPHSKTWRTFVTAFAVSLSTLIIQLSTVSALAQSYAIDWYKIAGGGGTSTGGVYAVSGTIGQHDAGGPMTGGNFSLTGGFWSLYSVQTPGAPVLSIKLTATNTALVYWPSPSTGYNLQVNTDLATTNWVTPAESVTDNGTNKYIIVNPPAGNRFYRLKNP